MIDEVFASQQAGRCVHRLAAAMIPDSGYVTWAILCSRDMDTGPTCKFHFCI